MTDAFNHIDNELSTSTEFTELATQALKSDKDGSRREFARTVAARTAKARNRIANEVRQEMNLSDEPSSAFTKTAILKTVSKIFV